MKPRASNKVIMMAKVPSNHRAAMTQWWPQVREIPLLKRREVFSRGIENGLKVGIWNEGHLNPLVISVHLPKATYLAKKDIKNITSLPINQHIEVFIAISRSKLEKPLMVNSHQTSCNHSLRAASVRKRYIKKEPNLITPSNQNITLMKRLKIPRLRMIGQGDGWGTKKTELKLFIFIIETNFLLSRTYLIIINEIFFS